MNISSNSPKSLSFSGSLGFNAYIENGKSLYESKYFYKKSSEIPWAWEIVPLTPYSSEGDTFISSTKLKPIEKDEKSSKSAKNYSVGSILEDIRNDKNSSKIFSMMALIAGLSAGAPIYYISTEKDEPQKEYKIEKHNSVCSQNNSDWGSKIVLETKSGDQFAYDWNSETPIKLDNFTIASIEDDQ